MKSPWLLSTLGIGTIVDTKNFENSLEQSFFKVSFLLQESMTKEEVEIDARVHSMIIGRRGQGIRKIMTDFKVDIKFPRDGEENLNLVVISGDEDAVLDCKDHLLNLEEEFLQDVQDREWMEEYTKPTSKQPKENNNTKQGKGFEIKGAP